MGIDEHIDMHPEVIALASHIGFEDFPGKHGLKREKAAQQDKPDLGLNPALSAGTVF
jgi:hypothetical protein